MKLLRLVLCAMALLSTAANAQPSLAPHTTWVNDHDSELVIDSIGPDGRLTGTYANRLPDFKCRTAVFPLAGWLDGDMISFAVRWKNAELDCTSITSWTGYVSKGRILVEWNIVYQDQGQPRVRRGTDEFKLK